MISHFFLPLSMWEGLQPLGPRAREGAPTCWWTVPCSSSGPYPTFPLQRLGSSLGLGDHFNFDKAEGTAPNRLPPAQGVTLAFPNHFSHSFQYTLFPLTRCHSRSFDLPLLPLASVATSAAFPILTSASGISKQLVLPESQAAASSTPGRTLVSFGRSAIHSLQSPSLLSTYIPKDDTQLLVSRESYWSTASGPYGATQAQHRAFV